MKRGQIVLAVAAHLALIAGAAEAQSAVSRPGGSAVGKVGEPCSGFSFSPKVSIATRLAVEPVPVSAIVEGGPADGIGLAVGDRVLELNAVDVRTIPALASAFKATVGARKELKVARGDSTFTIPHTSGVMVADSAARGGARCAKAATDPPGTGATP